MIQLDVALIVVVVVFGIEDVIIRDARTIRLRIKRQVSLHDRVETVRRDSIIGELIANDTAITADACAVGIEDGRETGEIACTHRRSRHCEDSRQTLANASALIVGEEERPISAII